MAVAFTPKSEVSFTPSQENDDMVSVLSAINPEVAAKKTTSNIFALELGLDDNAVTAGYSEIVKNVYGTKLTPTEVQRRMEEDGLLASPKADDADTKAFAFAAATNTDPPEDLVKRTNRKNLINQTAGVFSGIRKQEENLFTADTEFARGIAEKPSDPSIVSTPIFEDEDLLDVGSYMNILNEAATQEQVQEIRTARKGLVANIYHEATRKQQESIIAEGAKDITTGSKTRDVILEGGKGLYSSLLTIEKGVMSTSVAMGMDWNQPNAADVDEKLSSIGMTRSEAAGKIGFVARAVSEAVPSFAYNMTVGKTGIFITEYGNSYQDVIDNGGSQAKATATATVVATINTQIESMQIDQIFSLAGAGAGAKQKIKKMVKDRAWKAFLKSGAKFTGQSLKTAINEGIEGALQEGVSITVPAIITGVYPKNEDGTIDWVQVGSQIGQSFVGEGLGGLFLGTGGALYNAKNKHNYKMTVAGQLITHEGMTESQALTTATDILERMVAQDGAPKDIYREEVSRVKPADNRHKASAHIVQKARGIGDDQYRDLAEETTGKRSLTEMNYEEAERFIAALKDAEVQAVEVEEGQEAEPEATTAEIETEVAAQRDNPDKAPAVEPSPVQPVTQPTVAELEPEAPAVTETPAKPTDIAPKAVEAKPEAVEGEVEVAEIKPITEKETEDGKETIIEPATGLEVEQRKAGRPISEVETTGKLNPTDPKDALKITERHAQFVEAEKEASIGGVFSTKFDKEKGEFVIDEIEYTAEQVDAAYRLVQKSIPSPIPDTKLFAMPGQESKLEAIAKKMQRQKKLTPKKKGIKTPAPRTLPKAKIKTEDHIKAVHAAAASESTRFALNGVLVEGDTIVATDGRRLFWAKGEWGKGGLYTDRASLKKGVLGKADKKHNFPKWRDIVPEIDKKGAIVVNDIDKVLRHVQQASLLTNEDSKGLTILVNKKGDLGFASANPEVGHAEVNVFPGAKILTGVNPQFLIDALRFHAIRGDTGFEFFVVDHARPMRTRSFDGKTSTITMPVNIDIEPSEAIAAAIEPTATITEQEIEPTPAETIKQIERMSYKELQTEAKSLGIKGNQKKDILINRISALRGVSGARKFQGGFIDNTPFKNSDQLEQQIDDIIIDAPKPKKEKKPVLTLKQLKKTRKSEALKTAATDLVTGIDKALGVMSTRVKNISPQLFKDIRNRVINPGKLLTAQRNLQAEPFVVGINEKLSEQDRVDFEIAQWQGNQSEVNRIVTKYGLIQEYADYRIMLDEVYHEGNSVGMDIDYQTAYFPSAVKDFDGLMKEIGRREEYAPIVQAMKTAEERKGRPLSEDERLRLVDTLLRGFRISGLTLSKPGFAKERTLIRDDVDLIKFYHGFEESTSRYVESMTENIQERKFFGKTTQELVDLRANISRTQTSIAKIENGLSKAKNPDAALAKAKLRLAKLEAELSLKDDNLLGNSVASHVLDLVEQGLLRFDQQNELKGILEGLFKVKGSNKFIHTARSLEFAGSLAQVPAVITQYGEIVLSILAAPGTTLPAFVRSNLRKSKITLKDLGVAHIGQEWVDADLDSTVTALLKPFQFADNVGKETFVNSVVDKWRKVAKSNPDKARKEIAKFYPESGVDAVLESLKSGKVDNNVKGFALNELADVQPISKFEVPELFAKAGNLRIFYMYKTFVLKRLDILRSKGYNEIKAGVKAGNNKQIASGLAKLIWLTFMFSLADSSADAVKDFIRGKPIDSMPNYMMDNLLQMILISKFSLIKSKQEGLGSLFKDNIAMPVSNLNAAGKDINSLLDPESEKGSELVRRIPWIGELYYWYMGEGARKLDEGVFDE